MKKGKQILSLLLVVCIIAGLSYNLVFAAPAVGEPSGGKRKVTFQYDNATATSVYVAGNFNSWNGNDPDWQMQKNSSGIWELSKDMKENTYYYKFVVDGNWINDPTNNFFIDDGSDNKNNRLVVPGDVTSPVVCGSSVTINFPVAEVPVGTTGVTVKGEFNGWAEENMTKSDDGLHYTCTINDLDPGTYEYGINMHTNEGEKYYRDFYNMETNGNGSNSVFTVNGCTVSFNANGGSGSMPDISNIAGDYELPNNTFAAPTDKRFKGWSDISGGSGRIYSPGSNYYVTKDTTLYAIWEDDPASLKHTIYFNANGGTGTMANADVTAGNYQLPSNGFTAPPGKKFKAWAEGSEFGPQYDVGYRYDVNKNTTFYAIWEDITHTVSFDSNGGSGDMPDETVKVGNYILPNNTFTPPSGKQFKGWSKTKDGSGTVYNQGAAFDLKGDTTLYAIWEDEPSLNCTISFNANGGRGFMNNGDAISGSNYELPINGFTSPDGYKFEAWAEGSTSGTQYKEKEPYTVSANTTFYAIWEKLPTVSISASSTSISGGGSVTLTTSPAADSVTCSDTSIVVTGSGNTWKATLPNTTASYTFSALAGGYINGSCTVSVTHVHKGGTATCQSPAVCDDCGKPYGNKDMNNHSGETEIRDKKDATDTQEGYTGDRYCLGCNTKIATGSVIPATGGSIQPPTEKLTIIRNTELKEVPESLKSTNFNTVEKIKNELVRVMTLQSGYTETNTSIYDVKMRVTIDGGETWVDATESDFPTEGITVKLPYPSGTGKDSHDFVVAHMFTVTSKRLGTVAGQIETPEVTKLDDGIQVTLKGLSPVSIAWKDISSDEGDETDGTTTPVTPIDMVEPTVSTTNVNTEENESKSLSNVLKTGDNTNIKFYFGTMITSLIGLFAFVVTRKKKGAK